ncbi:MAG: hypothetical protein NT084_09360 [Bacteroidetes bacterium]|jgi:hypothetical protein|nr:hypothetical protein [Bacteroidota bacterium]
MKRKYSILLFLLCSGNSVFCQISHLNFSASYVYQYAPAWDEIIQTYNFSRSFNSNELNLFINGFEVGGAWNVKIKSGKFEINPGISYQRFTTLAKNNDLRLRASINSYFFHSNFIWNFGQQKFWPNWLSLDPTFNLINPSVRINKKEIALDQTKKYLEFGPAFRLGLETGWIIVDSKHKSEWKPFIRVDWYPEAELFDFGAALNGSYIYNLKDFGPVLQFSAGVRYYFLKESSVEKK